MSRRLTLGLFALLCAAQLATAASSIAHHERTLERGALYRFATAPIDPLDLFRGRYVQLAFEAASVPLPLPEGHGEHVYAVLGTDAEGLAAITALRNTPPPEGDYLRVRAWPTRGEVADVRTRVELPFDRFYMEESLAPEAERLYRERAGGRPAIALVRVHGGEAVLEELLIDGEPIADHVRRMR